jgi:NAD-dependent dihydropyrimidine dehydrogenase PreA subunit
MRVAQRPDRADCDSRSKDGAGKPSCCGPTVAGDCPPGTDVRRLAVGWLDTAAGRIPRIGTELTWRDWLGTAVLAVHNGTAEIVDRDGCMECGACALNCPEGALSVRSGVGCAYALLKGKLRGSEPTCD